MKKYTLEVITGIVIVVFIAIFFVQNAFLQPPVPSDGSLWGGTDDRAAQAIRATGYEPWINPLWMPLGEEMTTLIFTLQAATGALVIGYFFGYYRGKRQKD